MKFECENECQKAHIIAHISFQSKNQNSIPKLVLSLVRLAEAISKSCRISRLSPGDGEPVAVNIHNFSRGTFSFFRH